MRYYPYMATPRALSRTCSPADAVASVRGLAPDGYDSTTLYRRYVEHCDAEGRSPSRQVLYSSTLAGLGVDWRLLNGRRQWLITEAVAAAELPSMNSAAAEEELTVRLPPRVYAELQRRAAAVGSPPDRMARRILGDELGW